MGTYEEQRYPWLRREKLFLEQALRQEKSLLGICLGSQLIADVLGSKVYRNKWKEIGWFPVTLTEFASFTKATGDSDGCFTPFHWHGDTFDLPEDAHQLCRSEGCEQQGFSFRHNVLAFQFHPEATRESVELLLQHCSGDLTPGKFVQTQADILGGFDHLHHLNAVFDRIMTHMECTALESVKQ
jgi:GMP synthase (glutamine-hydrolysing)